MMLFTTTSQFAVLALCLVAGWIFGLASHPGGKKAKARLREVQAEHDIYRKDAETRVRDAQARAKAAETERDRLAKAAPVATAAPVAAAAATPAGGGVRGLFGGERDTLSRIRGIDADLEARLHAEGFRTYGQVESMSVSDEHELERRLGLSAGRIAQEQWREQAAMLASGAADEHARRYV
ncbi:hypothetical protein M9980_01745 [Sphingomonas donggukensis]|uniref:Flap endonuclease-1-like 5' DNA nuclease n=1 Tax=Sphingomonas donggukensis TaxID=2949093 RepID=A0ABY4TUG8_9SPHN|nr:hypothetical protein [Sphingomonas donggukensis]URW75978.1 hypothetical protein M9980_01745 [Sphingomonas donggukensis]